MACEPTAAATPLIAFLLYAKRRKVSTFLLFIAAKNIEIVVSLHP